MDESFNTKYMIYQYVDQCEVTREYKPSAMEQRHVDVAFTHSNRDEAMAAMRAYVSREDQVNVLSDVETSVKKRMQTDEHLDGDEDETSMFMFMFMITIDSSIQHSVQYNGYILKVCNLNLIVLVI